MEMDSPLAVQQQALLDRSLNRAADVLGDITPHVFARYYDTFPDARRCFLEHGGTTPHDLEGEMVAQVIYLLMEWVREGSWATYIWATTVPHHVYTLHVPVTYFVGLSDAVIDTIVATIPPDCESEQRYWDEVRTATHDLVAEAARE